MELAGVKRTDLFRVVKVFALLLMVPVVFSASAAEPPTKEVLQMCRAVLSSEKGGIIVDWSTKPLPPGYREVAKSALQNDTVGGWIAHTNPNRTLTIVIYAFDPETQERHFIILFRDKGLIMKKDVSAFEFALSSREYNGVTGLFFCNKKGPSAEWVWNGSDWK